MSGTTDTVLTDAITKRQLHDPPGTSNGSAHTPGLGVSATTSGAARVNSGLAGIANHPPGASLPGERQARESDDLQSSEEVNRPMHTLSPGERTRVGLALLTTKAFGALILDEPTNHLDIPAIEQLESALCAYDGTLIVVTHDEEFAERLALDQSIELRRQ